MPSTSMSEPLRRSASPASAVPVRRRRSGYAPPPDVVALPIATLIGHRRVPAKLQGRLGFGDEQEPGGRSAWTAGDLALLERPCVAVVGTRDVSTAGAARTRRLARELVRAGVVIVSGLARGVDTVALETALEHGGRVAAVIGTPIDQAYPAENAALQETIYRDHLLISQFASGARVFRSNFPERNKLMAAISDATVIMEAGETSGTLHQAAECVRLERWLFIARSMVEDPRLTWPADFLKPDQGRVQPLDDTAQILAALGVAPASV